MGRPTSAVHPSAARIVCHHERTPVREGSAVARVASPQALKQPPAAHPSAARIVCHHERTPVREESAVARVASPQALKQPPKPIEHQRGLFVITSGRQSARDLQLQGGLATSLKTTTEAHPSTSEDCLSSRADASPRGICIAMVASPQDSQTITEVMLSAAKHLCIKPVENLTGVLHCTAAAIPSPR